MKNLIHLLIPEEGAIIENLIDENWFIAKDWNLPGMHFKECVWDDEKDHNWHEFSGIEETNDIQQQNNQLKNSWKEFLSLSNNCFTEKVTKPFQLLKNIKQELPKRD